jgi:hypothetical protein
MTAKQQILAKYPKSYCIKMDRLGVYMAYVAPSDSGLSGVGDTAVKAWKDLLSELQKQGLCTE